MDIFKQNFRFKTTSTVFLAAVFTTTIVGSVYLYFFHDFSIGNTNDFAAFGDYFGGTLNPILTLITIWFLVHSTNLQRDELTAVIKEAEENNNIQKMIAKQNLDAMTLPDIRLTLDHNLTEVGELINRKCLAGVNENYYSIYQVCIIKEAQVAARKFAEELRSYGIKELPPATKQACANFDGISSRLRVLYLALREYQVRGGALSYQKYVIDIAIAANKALIESQFDILNTGKQLQQFKNLRSTIEKQILELEIEPLY
ncbi:hypothetical protein GCM10009128_24810 [Psychrosphaera haliotis]|uniref:hypothetical protein n=1 Tax=Psychrosphaera haliotis TaxID=555083 RepID=UPI0031CDD7C9